MSKAPTKNEFFRTHGTFRPELKLVNIEVGMEKQYFAVDPMMESAVARYRHQLHRAHAVSDDHAARRRSMSFRSTGERQ